MWVDGYPSTPWSLVDSATQMLNFDPNLTPGDYEYVRMQFSTIGGKTINIPYVLSVVCGENSAFISARTSAAQSVSYNRDSGDKNWLTYT